MIYLATDAPRHKVGVGGWPRASSLQAHTHTHLLSPLSCPNMHPAPRSHSRTQKDTEGQVRARGTGRHHTQSLVTPLENKFPGTSISPAVWDVLRRRRKKRKKRRRSPCSRMGPGQQPRPPQPLLKGCCLQLECKPGLEGYRERKDPQNGLPFHCGHKSSKIQAFCSPLCIGTCATASVIKTRTTLYHVTSTHTCKHPFTHTHVYVGRIHQHS